MLAARSLAGAVVATAALAALAVPALAAGGTTSTTTTAIPPTTTTTLPGDVVPPEIQAQIDAYPRSPARSTDALVDALRTLPDPRALGGFGRFPVAGTAVWSDDWLFPRFEPTFHVHQGTDVFADRGTTVLAPAAGVARVASDALGGLTVTVIQPDGTRWYLAHLDRTTVENGTPVTPGIPLGVVGTTGDARGGPPHVHVEVHPLGGAAVDPKPYLDAALDDALAHVPVVVATARASLLRLGVLA
jgi:murein DD-endopeptidase MepM/ murein hydrolase activator NlpD